MLHLPPGPLRLLCLGAHSDDLEIGCAGLISRLVATRRELDVLWVVFSGDDERQREARDCAGELLSGAGSHEVVSFGFRDGFFPAEFAGIKQEFEGLKRFAPTLVLTHRPDDAHQDHRTVADLTYNTFRNQLILEYEIPKYDGDLGNPNMFVPLSRAEADAKADLLMRHFGTQRARSWFTGETFLGLMRLRGVQSGHPAGFAEGFFCRRLLLADGAEEFTS